MPAIRRTQRNSTLAMTTLSRYYNDAHWFCQEAIHKKDEIPRMPYLFLAIEAFPDKICMALENYDIALEQKKVTEYKALFVIGQGLIEAMGATAQRNYTLCKATDDNDVPRNKARIAFRVYNVFQHWPQALDFMTKMPITHWHFLNDYEINQLQQVLLNEFI